MKYKRYLKMLSMVCAIAFTAMLLSCNQGGNTGTNGTATDSLTNSVSDPETQGNTVDPAETRTVRYVIPGGIPGSEEGFATVMEALNDKLEADNTGLAFELENITWDVWDQKVTLKLTNDEPFDLLHIMEDSKGFGAYLANESLTDITDLLAKHGPNITAKISTDLMEAATVNGRIYTIPAYWCEPAKGTYAITIRTDLLDENNLSRPNTLDDLMNAAQVIQDNWNSDGTPYIRILYSEPSRPLHRTFETYPFTVIEQLLMIDQEGNVSAWIETEEFQQEAAFFAEAYERGLVHPDVLTLPSDHHATEEELGRILFREGTGLQSLSNAEKYGYTQDLLWLNEEAEYFADMAFRNDNAVPITSRHPEAAIQFLDWVYSNQENYDLFMYGIKDYSYTDEGEGYYERILDDNENMLYNFSDWMVGNLHLARSRTTQHPSYIESHMVTDDSIVPTIISGFQFDSSAVSAEYANCVAEVKTSLYPIRVGIVKYEEGITSALQNLKAAGLDKVVEEYQRQLSDWLAERP